MRRYLLAGFTIALLSCGSSGSQILYGPVFVDQGGVDLIAPYSPEIKGEMNQLLITLPAALHPNYSILKIVDSTNVTATEFFADVELSTGQLFTFHAMGLAGAPGYPEQIVRLRPDDGVRLSGKVVRIHLRSTRPTELPQIQWQSWSQGI